MQVTAILLILFGLALAGYFFFQVPSNPGSAQNRTIGLILGGLLIVRGLLSFLARRK